MTVEFDRAVLAPDPERRRVVLGWLMIALRTADPERLTAEALAVRQSGPAAVIAIGKAAPAMARGAASILEVMDGICVSGQPDEVPNTMKSVVGDHPIPGKASYAAGAAVIDAVKQIPASVDLLALISGGGSALCESPREGVTADFLSRVNASLLSSGADIEAVNLVRSHLSKVKGGGLAAAAGRPIDTYVVSDVGAAGPEVVASGPTIPGRRDADAALRILQDLSIDVPDPVVEAMRARISSLPAPHVTVLADGRDVARAVAVAAPGPGRVAPGWLHGELSTCLRRFLGAAGTGVTVGAGEVTLEVTVQGSGGRNTHAALLAAEALRPGDLFCAFATDGVDGSADAAGAIVDRSTVVRGGDPAGALRRYDSAAYLAATSDLIRCGATGTNVSDLWILWRR
ncbi:MAG TPA: DUF4147 domain-containing protein [Acidimicrobiia bacterium]|nr:DUF4147 domain-containing protein [Acidimicrobiia bacterium]